ncbi:uncharacterized protein Dwil_GK21238 [Drosophila willistoni]|uniref:Uncharacterized protein n=1 Tax=Drosophila willistoni TaxID=7260 RepID=B4N2R3_DROWI|nr:uncharacterized protein Dwil_GK21238 [Drosophila willistoni]
MQKAIKKELSFSLDTLERYRAKYGRSASLDANGNYTECVITEDTSTTNHPVPSIFTKVSSPPKLTKLQELQQKKEAYLRAKEHEREMEQLQRAERTKALNGRTSSPPSAVETSKTPSVSSTSTSTSTTKTPASPAGYSNWSHNHSTLATQPWCAISDLMYFCDKYEFKTLSTRDLKTHQEIVAEVRNLLSGKAPFDQRTRFPGNIHDPENLWVCIGRCASVEYHLQRIISVFRKPLNQLTPDKQRTVRQNFHLAVSELRLDISARISEVRLYDRLVFEREFRLEWQDEKV